MGLLSRAKFELVKRTEGERFLATLSMSTDSLLESLNGKSVALVGNARSLSLTDYGKSIDTRDIVIRLNDAPVTSVTSHGTRTDWLAVAKKVSPLILNERQPMTVLWMPTSRKRLSHAIVSYGDFYLNPIGRNANLREQLGSPPSLGFMLIDLLQRSLAGSIALYGFDFFASKSLSGNRSAQQVPHDFDAEREVIEQILQSDRRFSLFRAAV